MAGFERGDQGNARHLDIADDEGRHVERAVLDDDLGAVRLHQHQIVPVDLDVVDRDIGRKLHDIAGLGVIFMRNVRGCRVRCRRVSGRGVGGRSVGVRRRLGCALCVLGVAVALCRRAASHIDRHRFACHGCRLAAGGLGDLDARNRLFADSCVLVREI
ncbi:MAG: hypothetical protein EOQ71_16540 [Mesorhizobium sp.]|nr:MAG: hypothetical protein EOQ71_16540 [Mesorhizobium sp.]